jgi:hypothetical protein
MSSNHLEDIRTFVNTPEVFTACSSWALVQKEYLSLMRLQDEMDRVLDCLSDPVAPLLDAIRAEERRLLEIKVAQANKTAPQNITEEMILSYSEMLSDQDTALRRVARLNAKSKGRPLLQKLHPDKGGDPVLFNIARRAVQSGDVELLQIFLYRLEMQADPAHEVLRRVQGRIRKTMGSRLYQIVRSYVSKPFEVTVNELRDLLEAKLFELKQLSTPGGFGPSEEGINDVEYPSTSEG